MSLDFAQLVLVFAALALGGVLKGATGAGAPVIAIPALAAVTDVKVAVAIMMMPNLLTNILQVWRFRKHRMAGLFAVLFAAGGAAGAIAGTYLLAFLPHEALALIVAFSVFGYVCLRMLRPDWKLGESLGRRLAGPVGLAAGVLQGASGISAPVSLSFLNALRLERPVYIATISLFFVAMTATQIPTLWSVGLFTRQLMGASLLAMLPILLFMPLGGALARRMTPQTFDRIILVMLTLLAVKLLYEATMLLG